MRADLVPHARAELDTRELHYPDQVRDKRRTADEAGRGLAAWRAIVVLLEHGQTRFEPCLGETPAIAWSELLAVVHAAIEHRAGQCRTDGGGPGDRLAALTEIRTLLIRSAVRQGASVLPVVEKPQRIAA